MKLKTRKKYVVIGCIVAAILAAAYIWNTWPYQVYEGTGMRPEWDVADNIVNSPGNQTFAEALYNLEYTTFLHGEGPFTVFVPTDKGYAELPDSTKKYFGNLDNQGAVRQALLYHVVKGRYEYKDLKDGMTLTTVQGEELTVTTQNGFRLLNGNALIETYDIKSKNGVIHLVDRYLLPPSMANLQ